MVRQPVFAGTWYEGEPHRLRASLEEQIASAPGDWASSPKVLIMPHAGHRYSGALAARAAAQLRPGVERVVLLGPSHQFAFKGVALPGSDGYATPLGTLPVDRQWATRARAVHEVVTEPRAHGREHSLEVILPFIQCRLGNVPVLPLVVGQIDRERLGALISHLWGGPETLIVVSTDLTHFLTAEQSAVADGDTAKMVELADSRALSGERACGFKALGAMLDEGQRRGLRFTRLGLMHSGQVSGDNQRVVGYGAWAGQEPDAARFGDSQRRELLSAARRGLELRLKHGTAPSINVATFTAPVQGMGASFVTLNLNGELRGCIGSLAAHQPLVQDVVANAVKAGFADTRFTPVTRAELDACALEISVLSRPAPLPVSSEEELIRVLSPGRDGLILEDGNRRATFLPKVWDSLPEPRQFLVNLKRKAGLADSHWSESLRVSRYTAENFA